MRTFLNVKDFLITGENKLYTTNKIKLFFVNAQSICSMEKFQAFQKIISSLKIRFDILIVVETWFVKDSLGKFNLYNLNGYSLCQASRSLNRVNSNIVGGGIAMYISNEIIFSDINSVVANFEKLSIKTRVNNKWIKIIAYYRPPSNTNIRDFLNDLETELSKDDIDDKLIVGDMNINVLEDSPIAREYKLLLDSYNGNIINKIVTRSKSNAIIDHIISQPASDSVISHTIELPGFSDHNAILSIFDIEKNLQKDKILIKKFIDHKKLERSFEIDHRTFHDCEEPNAKLKCLTDAIEEAVTKSSSTKTFKIKHPSIIDSWLSVKVLELMKEKDSLALKCRRRKKLQLPCSIILEEIKKLNKKIKKARINSYKAHFNNVIKNGDMKSMWKEINACIGVKKSGEKIFFEENNEILGDREICNNLNKYFVNVGENIIPSSNISVDNLNKFNTLPQHAKSFFLEPTTCEEVFGEILSLDKNKSAGSDEISIAVIKTLNSRVTPFLTEIINCMFEHGIYPDELKEGLVTAIPKCSNPKSENDLRPVTVLKCINKPIEKIWNHRLEKYFNKIGILDQNQFGFIKKCSTESAIMELHHTAMRAVNDGKKLGIVILDLKKAFDAIPHQIIMHKMSCYGIRGTPLRLIESYFNNRTQAVKLGSTIGDFRHVTRGIAQGGNISPLIFNISLNDFKDLPLKADKKLRYADDTVLLYEFDNEDQFVEKVKSDMIMLVEYFAINGMALNINKSSFLIFHKKKVDHLLNKITIDNSNSLNRVTSCRYLGIIFDEQLTFKEQIELIKRKLTSAVNLLRKLKWYLPTFILRLFYYAHFHSHLCYIPFTWGLATESNIKPLQILQNRALKHVFHLPVLFSTLDLFSGPAKGILPIKGIVAQLTLNFIHKSVTKKIRSNIKFEINYNNTKQNGEISRTRGKPPKTSFGKRDILNFAPIVFNKLPKEVRNSRFGIFRIKLKKILETLPSQLLNLSQFSLLNINFSSTNK